MWRVGRAAGGGQCLIPALGNNSPWNRKHITPSRAQAGRIYLPQDLFISIYHPWCRSLWLSDCPNRIYRRSCVPNRHFVVELAIDCHFTPQVAWPSAHSAGWNAQQWNASSHHASRNTVAILVSFVVLSKELLRVSAFRNFLRKGCSRLFNQHEPCQEMYWVSSRVHRWLAIWIKL